MSTQLNVSAVRGDLNKITHIRIVVHTTGPAGPVTSDNHWSIYLLLAENGGSVRVNIRAEFGDPTGRLEWTKQAYTLTHSAIRHWDFQVVGEVHVKDIAEHIYSLRRERYDMSGGGSGCRWWM